MFGTRPKSTGAGGSSLDSILRPECLTLPAKNVSLTEWNNSDKEKVNDEDIKGTVHARIQARGGQLVQGGQSIAAAARTLGVVEQTLFNWVKAQRQGRLLGVDSKPVSAEQMEISRLRAELARVKMERDILGKATAYFAKGLT